MRKSLLIVLMLVLIGSAFAELSYSGSMRARMTLWNKIQDEAPSNSKIDNRIRIKFNQKVNDQVSAVVRFEMGDFHWGDNNAADIGTDGKIVELKHAYMKFACPFGDGFGTVGLQGLADHHGIVLDDDFAGFIVKQKRGMMTTQTGFAKLVEGDVAKDDDYDLFFVNFMLGENGMQNYIGRSMAGEKLDFWFMPYSNMTNLPMFDLDAQIAINYSKYDDWSNFGYAFSLKAKTKDLPLDLGLNFLMTSADDGSDPESTSVFKGVSTYYMNGLEYMGWGANDGIGVGTRVGNDGNGNMDIVLTAKKEILPNINLCAAFGMLNSLEDVTYADIDDDPVVEEWGYAANPNGATNFGMEFDLGVSTKLYKTVSLKMVGAFFMPNKDVYGTDEMIKEITTVMSMNF